MISERICYAVIFAVEAAIAWFYFGNLYRRKKANAVLWISFILGYLLLFLLSGYDIIGLNSVSFFTVNLLLLLLNYECSIKAGILQAAFLAFINGLSEVIVNLGLARLGYEYDAYQYSFTTMLALVVLSKLLYLIIVFAVVRIFKARSFNYEKDDSNLTILLGIMPIVSAFIVVTVTYVGMSSALTSSTEIMLTISMLALLIVNLAVLIIYGQIQSIAAENMALNVRKAQDKALTEYYLQLKEQYNGQQILIHDIRKHLGVLTGILKTGEIEEAERYIDELSSLPSLSRSVKLCDNPLLNVILSGYTELAREDGISFNCNIKTSDFSFMDAASLTALFSNLFSNAVESAQKSTERYIEFSTMHNAENEYTMVSVVNSCDTVPKTNGDGKLITSKADRDIHGYGVKSIESVIDKYNGLLNMRYDATSKSFHCIIYFPDAAKNTGTSLKL